MHDKKKVEGKSRVIGIVGCGVISHDHTSAIRTLLPHAKLCFCDLDGEAAKWMADRVQAAGGISAAYTVVQEMMEREKPQSVHILTPPQSHFQLAKQALEAGCHVMVEKPVVESFSDLQELYDLADRKGRVLAVDHTVLGMPVTLNAKKEIKSGRLGDLLAIHCVFGAARKSLMAYDLDHWAYSLRGGILANNASHPASLLIEFMDPLADFQVQFTQRNLLPSRWPDLMQVTFRSEDQLGSFTMSVGHGNADRSAHLLLEGGSIKLDFNRQLYSCVRGKGPQNFVKKALSGVTEGASLVLGTFGNAFKIVTGRMPKSNPGLFNLVANFYEVIQSGGDLLVSRSNVRGVTKMLEDLWELIEKEAVETRGLARVAPIHRVSIGR